MKKTTTKLRSSRSWLAAALISTAAAASLQAATVTVTVADGPSNVGAPGTFYWAITNANAGDTIAFNIPGPGPHYLQVPPNGFPLVYKKHNLIIDGYSQPGASPNSNSITSSNNAVIKIVIDGRAGGSRDMAYNTYDGTLAKSDPPIDNTAMANDRAGYDSNELALLGVYRTTNINIRGLAFLGTLAPLSSGTVKGICFAHDYDLDTTVRTIFEYPGGSDAGAHINGCWFNVDPTNATPAGVTPSGMAMAAYRHRAPSGDPRPELPNIGMTIGVKKGSANPRAEFNVFVACAYAFDMEAIRTTISGNFFGVMPDGVTPYNVIELQPGTPDDPDGLFAGGQFEIGRYSDTQPIIVGTDGDGVNDADEGNIFGPLAPTGSDKPQQIEWYSTGRKPYILAGNRFGIAGNGTIWTNNSFTIAEWNLSNGTQIRFGSDFNGVSDAIEANIIYSNNDFDTLFPDPASETAPSLLRVFGNNGGADGWISVRGNQMVNNFPLYNPEQGSAGYTNSWSNYVAHSSQTVPTLTNSTVSQLNGTAGVPTNGYTNLVIDVYLPDRAGQTNGAKFDYEFFGGASGPGFVQGRTYLGNFLDNGPEDSNPAVGQFSFDITELGLPPGTEVTITATYSAFVTPKLAQPTFSGGNVTLSWTGTRGGPFPQATGGPSSGFGVLQSSSITGPWTATYTESNSIVLPASGSTTFYRIGAPIAGMTTLFATPVTLQ